MTKLSQIAFRLFLAGLMLAGTVLHAQSNPGGSIPVNQLKGTVAVDAGHIRDAVNTPTGNPGSPGPLKDPVKPFPRYCSAAGAKKWTNKQLADFFQDLANLAFAEDPDGGGEATVAKAYCADLLRTVKAVRSDILTGRPVMTDDLNNLRVLLKKVSPAQFGFLDAVRATTRLDVL